MRSFSSTSNKNSSLSLRGDNLLFYSLLLLCVITFVIAFKFIAHAPIEKTMKLAQKILYFHVPCAWLLLLSGIAAGGIASFLIFKESKRAKLYFLVFVEFSVLLGTCVFVSGMLWGKMAWKTFWVWDARLTSTLLLWLILLVSLFVYYFGGPLGPKLAYGMSIFGLIDIPLIYFSVNQGRTLHPDSSVLESLPPEMKIASRISLLAFALLYILLLWLRIRVKRLEQTLQDIQSFNSLTLRN